MPTQLCYVTNWNLGIHQPWNARFPHKMVGHISWQPCIFSRCRQKFADVVFFQEVLDCTRPGCQALCYGLLPRKRGVGFLHSFRTMAGKLKIKTNWAALGVSCGGFWTKSHTVTVSFWSSFGFPHKHLLSTNWIIFYCYFTPLQSSTLVPCSKPEMQRQHPPHCAQENFGVVFPKLTSFKQQVFFISC